MPRQRARSDFARTISKNATSPSLSVAMRRLSVAIPEALRLFWRQNVHFFTASLANSSASSVSRLAGPATCCRHRLIALRSETSAKKNVCATCLSFFRPDQEFHQGRIIGGAYFYYGSPALVEVLLEPDRFRMSAVELGTAVGTFLWSDSAVFGTAGTKNLP